MSVLMVAVARPKIVNPVKKAPQIMLGQKISTDTYLRKNSSFKRLDLAVTYARLANNLRIL